MKKQIKLVFLISLIIGCLVSIFPNSDIEAKDKYNREEVKNAKDKKYRSVVLLQYVGQTDKDYGTGFVYDKNYIITNKHVVEEAANNLKKLRAKVKVGKNKYISYELEKVKYFKDSELAVLKVKNDKSKKCFNKVTKPLEIASDKEIASLKKGSNVSVIGYPVDKKYGTLWTSKGKIVQHEKEMSILDAYITSGNSGSPILNSKNHVIGTTFASNGNDTYGLIFDKETKAFLKNKK